MVDINWNALSAGIDRTGRQFDQNMERVTQGIQQHSLRRAVEDFQRDPTNQKALGYLYSVNPNLAAGLERSAQTRAELGREAEARTALSDYLLTGGTQPNALAGAVPVGVSQANTPGQPNNALRSVAPAALGRNALAPNAMVDVAPPVDLQRTARERAIRANPEGFLTFEGKRLDISKRQLESYRDLNDTAMQLLGGVHDQSSYEAAKSRAQALYAQHGMDLSSLNLPDQYSPELVESLRLQGMDTAKQMAAIARENRLSWDVEDDQIDNERADRNLASLEGYRSGQLSNARRGQDLADRRARRGQELTDARGRRGQDMADRRTRRGQDITDQRVRESAAFRGRHGRIKQSEPVARGPNGETLVVRGGRWVDTRTGNPVQ